ncbi:CoA-binding protein [Salinisphaera japonica]|uniref:CoA-binding protein n=1 Tax=Salinisphaera japonica YTM-1 TaxID=1209778 RepID=A0A423PH71_9GAMM|nr:CoA-binding protein [Salinisphaera japonica]ROO24826.1 CoA-binding protein [Salinisphaera japonica YTM-1]
MTLVDDDATIRDILAQVRRIAVIGLSPDPERPSHGVAKGMIEAGYDIIPVNPFESKILGRKTFADLKYVSDAVNMVAVFREPKHVPEIVEMCIEKKVRNLWLQEGVIHNEAAKYAAEHGMHVVMDRCMFKEYSRLLG